MRIKSSLCFIGLSLIAALSTGCIGMRSCEPMNLGALQGFGSRMACTGGCGEVYVGEYINHPPMVDPCGCCETGDCGSCDSCETGSCDGCDSCGVTGRRRCSAEYTGMACQPGRPVLQWISQFWGIPYQPTSCGNCGVDTCLSCRGGCNTCGRGGQEASQYGHSGCSSCSGGEMVESHSMVPSERYDGSLAPVPTPDPVPSKAAETQERVPAAPKTQAKSTSAKSTSARRLAPAVRKQTSSRLVTESNDR